VSAITIIRSRKPAVLCKRFEAIGGVLRKTAVAHVTEGTCHTLPVESATDMIQALNEVTASRDLCIVPGVWLGASDEPFDLVTEAKLGEMLGNEVKGGVQVIDGRRVAARVKRGIEPSAWLLIDADDPPGIPDDWKAMSLAERLAFLEPLIPGISRCERIELRSSSARVVNGDGTPKPASHAWLRVSDPGRIETLRARVQIEMVNRGLSFPSPRYSRAEPGKVIGHEHRTVVDLSVWITGRIVFNAMPQLGVGMEAYTVTDPGITVVNAGAGALDIDWAVRPDAEALERYREATGVQVLISERGANISTTCTGELTLDTEIEARGVTKTLRDWAAGLRPGERLRCEAPFRASSSEAAFIKVPANGGMPFVHDVGTGTTYRIEEPEIEAGDPRPDPPPEPSTVATRTRQRKESEDIAAGFAPPMVAEHLTLEQMLEEMVYVADGSRVSRRGCPWYSLPLSEFKKLTSASVTAVGKRLIPTADAWVADAMRRTVHTVTFRPGAPEFTQNTEGAAALNTWRPYVRPSSSASVEPFLDHVTYLVPIQEERERFLKWLAHIEQQPGVLPHTHYLMVTPQTGIGRNWLAGLLGRVWHGASRLGFDLAGVLEDHGRHRLGRQGEGRVAQRDVDRGTSDDQSEVRASTSRVQRGAVPDVVAALRRHPVGAHRPPHHRDRQPDRAANSGVLHQALQPAR
jgi:hypothetical protein